MRPRIRRLSDGACRSEKAPDACRSSTPLRAARAIVLAIVASKSMPSASVESTSSAGVPRVSDDRFAIYPPCNNGYMIVKRRAASPTCGQRSRPGARRDVRLLTRSAGAMRSDGRDPDGGNRT
jgi:hypothetical protein